MQPFGKSQVEEPVREPRAVECLVCGASTLIRSDVRIARCDCGAALLNPAFAAQDTSVGSADICEMCDGTGFVLFPMSSEGRFYTAVARCECKVGESMSERIPAVPESWEDRRNPVMNTFFGRAEMVVRGIESVAKKMRGSENKQGASK